MKKFMLVLILISAMPTGLASSSHAVHLQQGWYAWFGGISIEGPYNPDTGYPYYWKWWQPATPLGQSGPLDISLYAGYPSSRMVTVRADADVAPGLLWEDVGTEAADQAYYFIGGNWKASYDPGAMRLRLLRRRTGVPDVVIMEETSGQGVGQGWSIYYPLAACDRLVFQVTVVPEPTSLAGLMLGAGALIKPLRRLLRR